jgi:thioredoxin-like negative regulator of GroEL
MPEIEQENDQFSFVEVDRDLYMDLAQKWDIFGIPSFVVLQDGVEIGRLVNKDRKTKEEVDEFLAGLK